MWPDDPRDIAAVIVEALRPLLDPENCTAFMTCWELDSFNTDINGDIIWRDLKNLVDEYDKAMQHSWSIDALTKTWKHLGTLEK
jgi:hypothetical protein